MTTAFPRAKKLNTASTTSENTVLDIAFTSCNNAQSDVITCVWSYHHTLVVSCYSQDMLQPRDKNDKNDL